MTKSENLSTGLTKKKTSGTSHSSHLFPKTSAAVSQTLNK